MKKFNYDKLELLVDSHHGIYSAQILFESYGHYFQLPDEKREYYKNSLSNPDNENYIDAWVELENETLVNDNGEKMLIYPFEGDIFAIPENMEWPDDF